VLARLVLVRRSWICRKGRPRVPRGGGARTDDEVLSLPTYTTTSFHSFRLSKNVAADRLGIVTKNGLRLIRRNQGLPKHLTHLRGPGQPS
jgi:hypothetical protein